MVQSPEVLQLCSLREWHCDTVRGAQLPSDNRAKAEDLTSSDVLLVPPAPPLPVRPWWLLYCLCCCRLSRTARLRRVPLGRTHPSLGNERSSSTHRRRRTRFPFTCYRRGVRRKEKREEGRREMREGVRDGAGGCGLSIACAISS